MRAHRPCSKADLVRLSGLTTPTVSLAIAQIAGLGLVEKLGNGKSSCGRPPALLRFNAAHGYVAAADIGGTRLRMMLADLNGRPVAQWAVAMTDRQKSSRGIVSLVQTGLCAMVQEAGARDRVLHLTVGAPGITDVSRGVVLARPNLAGWNSVPLRKLLEAETASKSRSRTIPTWPR